MRIKLFFCSKRMKKIDAKKLPVLVDVILLNNADSFVISRECHFLSSKESIIFQTFSYVLKHKQDVFFSSFLA